MNQFQELQRMAYECVKTVEASLEIGDTEEMAVQRMEQFFKERGVNRFFHKPFAWFGDRTGFENFSTPFSLKLNSDWKITLPNSKNVLPHLGREFFPTKKKLKKSDWLILDVAPIGDNACVDIGYTSAFDKNEEYQQARIDLLELRALLPQWVEDLTGSEVYQQVDEFFEKRGYKNRHQYYPAEVLGHRVDDFPYGKLPNFFVYRFGIEAYASLFRKAIKALKSKNSYPLINRQTNWKLHDGLWAIEPHLEVGGKGMKFEEILVLKEGKANWLEPSPLW